MDTLEDEETSSGDRRSAAFLDGLREILDAPGAAAGDHRHIHRFTDAPDQGEVVAFHFSVAIDGIDENLAGAELLKAFRPFAKVSLDGLATALRLNSIAADEWFMDVDRDHDALAAKSVGHFAHKLWLFEREGIH